MKGLKQNESYKNPVAAFCKQASSTAHRELQYLDDSTTLRQIDKVLKMSSQAGRPVTTATTKNAEAVKKLIKDKA